MTKRQKTLGVSEYAIQRGIKDGEFMLSNEYFLARISTVKKGNYYGRDIVEMLFGQYSSIWHYDIKRYLFGLTTALPKNFQYSDTYGLDILTIK